LRQSESNAYRNSFRYGHSDSQCNGDSHCDSGSQCHGDNSASDTVTDSNSYGDCGG
jgi:hypothetical protein